MKYKRNWHQARRESQPNPPVVATVDNPIGKIVNSDGTVAKTVYPEREPFGFTGKGNVK